jgi:hypothetical protein
MYPSQLSRLFVRPVTFSFPVTQVTQLPQQIINILNIIKRIIQVELKFGHHAQLVVHPLCKVMPDFTAMVPDFIEQDLFIGGDEQAQVDFRNRKIFAHLNLGHCDQCSIKQVPALLLENDA